MKALAIFKKINYSILLFISVGLIISSCGPKGCSEPEVDVKPYFGTVKLIFEDYQSKESMPYDYVNKVTLIRYAQESQDPGVEVKRWPGDDSGKYKYVELESREIDLKEYPSETLLLKTGTYQIKHNSVIGTPPSGYYGESEFFEIKVGDKLKEIKVVLFAAI